MGALKSDLSGKAAAIGGLAAALIVLALGIWIGKGQDAQPDVEPKQVALKIKAASLASPQPSPAKIAVPAFDEVRREPDGMTVAAGRAAPGAEVQLLQDGKVVITTTADDAGKFAAVTVIEPDGLGHVLSLSQQLGDTVVASQDEVILAPTEAVVPTTGVADPGPASPLAAAAATAPAPQPKSRPNDTAVLKSTAAGVELLNTAAPEVMQAVALDTISYSDTGDVQLAGRARPATQAVRVYLDNRAVINLPVDDQGRWRGDVPDIDAGVYTLRVDEVAADGRVTSRVETPFKRESAAVLVQAAAKAQGAIKAVTVQTGATLWAIARDRYGEGRLYVRVFNANKDDIRDPDLIYPGQVFDLPD